jgi:hypothetical protein
MEGVGRAVLVWDADCERPFRLVRFSSFRYLRRRDVFADRKFTILTDWPKTQKPLPTIFTPNDKAPRGRVTATRGGISFFPMARGNRDVTSRRHHSRFRFDTGQAAIGL